MKSKIVPCSAFGETNFSTEIKRFVLATDCLQLYKYTPQYFTQLCLKPITLSMEQKLIFNAITQINFRFSGGGDRGLQASHFSCLAYVCALLSPDTHPSWYQSCNTSACKDMPH